MISQRKMDAIRLIAEDRIGRIMEKALVGYLGDRRNYGNLPGENGGQLIGDSQEEQYNLSGIVEGEPGSQASIPGSEFGDTPGGGNTGIGDAEYPGRMGQVL